MTRTFATLIALGVMASPALADGHLMGDPTAGEKTFSKCKSCHQIVSDAGEEIVKGGAVGPNLWNVMGRKAGTTDFKYGDDLVAAGEKGLVWDQETLAEYVQDPRAFLQTYLDDKKAKSKMAFKLKDGGADVAAYLMTVSPDAPVTN
jgi:cytochrome c